MPVLTGAQLVGPPRPPAAVLGLPGSFCAGGQRPNFRSGNETAIPKVTGWDHIPAGPYDGSSIGFRPGGTNQDVFSLRLFSPQPRHLPCPRTCCHGASLFAQPKMLLINSPSPCSGQYWGRIPGETANAVLLFEVLKARHQEVLLF